MKSRFFLSLMTLVVSMTAVGCNGHFERIGGKEFNSKLNAKPVNTMESWWMVKDDKDFYYLEDRRGFEKHCYMVSKQDVMIAIAPQAKFPVNLKIWDVRLLDRT